MKGRIAELTAWLTRKVTENSPLSDFALELTPFEKASPSFFDLGIMIFWRVH
jgi:hypothetical protein